MRKLFLIGSFFIVFLGVQAQNYYHYVGDISTTTTVNDAPMNTYYYYSWTRTLYLASEVGNKTINSIAFRCQNEFEYTYANQSCYFKLVTLTDLTTDDGEYHDPVNDDGATLVWSGSLPSLQAGDWFEMTLATPFDVPAGYGLLVYYNHAVTSSIGNDYAQVKWYQANASTDHFAMGAYDDPDAAGLNIEGDYKARPLTRFGVNSASWVDCHLLQSLTIDNVVSPTTQSVGVNVKNNYTTTMTSAVLGWELNGVLQSDNISWSGNIASLANGVCNIGSYIPKLNDYDTIKVWVNSINGNTLNTQEPLTAIILSTNDIVLEWQKYIDDIVYVTGPFDIKIKATSLGGKTISSINFVYSISGGADNTLAMTDNGDGTWSVTCPQIPLGSTLDYRVETTDYKGDIVMISKTSTIDNSKTYVYIGDPNTTATLAHTPLFTNNNYSWSRMLYTASEVGGSTIYNIAFKKSSSSSYIMANQSCYFKLVTLADLSSDDKTYHDPISDGATLVWSGFLPRLSADGWFDMELTTPFVVPAGYGLLVYYNGEAMTPVSAYVWLQSTTATNLAVSGNSDVSLSAAAGAVRTRPLARFTRSWLPNSVALQQIVSPLSTTGVVAPGSYPLSVELKNKGSNNLNCTIHYTINGTSYSYNYTGNLSCDFVDTANITTLNLAQGDVNYIKIWVEKTDPMTFDDTLEIMVVTCDGGIAAGTYTIGPSASADFASLDQFFRNIQYCGIANHGTFRLEMETGTHIGAIHADYAQSVFTSADTIILTSATGNATDVVLSHSEDVIVLKKNYNVTITDITITPTTNTAKGINISGPSYNVEISNCVFNMPVSTNSASTAIYWTGESKAAGNLRILNNIINNGYNGIYLTSGNTSSNSTIKTNTSRVTVKDNTISNFYKYGIYATSYTAVDYIVDNIISTNRGSSCAGIYFSSNCLVDGGVERNKLTFTGGSVGTATSASAIYLSSLNTAATGASANALVANNEVRRFGNGAFFGVYLTNSNLNFYHNTIYRANDGNGNCTTLYVGTYSATYNANIKNNIFYAGSTATNYVIRTSNANYIKTAYGVNLDYNDYYATGNYFGRVNTTNITDLAGWQAQSLQDAHSVSIAPTFVDASIDADISNYSDFMAPNVGVGTDINSVVRVSSTPMGAYCEEVSTITESGTGNTYADLATAINACNTTGVSGSPYTLTLNDNASIGAIGTINKNITINVVSSTSGVQRSVFRTATNGYINNISGTLNVTDIVFDGQKGAYVGDTSFIVVGGTLNMSNCNMQACKTDLSGGALSVVAGGTATIDGVAFTENEATYGGAILNAGTLNFNTTASTIGGTALDANTANNGGAMCVKGGTVNCTIVPNMSYNNAIDSGGALFVCGGTINIAEATTISNCQAEYGGAIATRGGAITLEKLLTLSDDTATLGGAIYLDGGTLTVNGADTAAGLRITANKASKGGGMFFADGTITNNSKPNIVINKNNAPYGGAIYCDISATGAKTIGNICMLWGNTASGRGGGIYFKGNNSTDVVTLTQAVEIKNNTADSLGAGVFVEAYPIAFADDVEIHHNNTIKTTTGSYNYMGGAGIYNMGTLNFTGGDVSIHNNVSQGHGGGIFNFGGTINCIGGDMAITNNTTRIASTVYHYTGKGGAIYDTIGTITIGASGNARSLTISDNTASLGGGLHIGSDGLTSATLTCWGDITIERDSARYGGGIYNYGGTVDCKGTMKIDKNGSYYRGGGILNYSGTCNYSGTVKITNNYQSYTSNYGGGVYNNATTTFAGATTIEGNHAGSSGGGVYTTSAGPLTFAGGADISKNTGTYGGGIYIPASAVVNVGTDEAHPANLVVSKDTARTGEGGGIHNKGTLNCYGNLTIFNDTSVSTGGGIHNEKTIVVYGTSTIDSNTAKTNGGGIYNTGATSSITCHGAVSMKNNRAETDGGGLYTTTSGSTITFAGGLVVDSCRANNGGGINVDNAGSIVKIGTDAEHPANLVLSRDSAATGAGGGIYNIGLVYCYGNLTAMGDTAKTTGGAIHNTKTLEVHGTAKIKDNIAYTKGGGIYNTGTSMSINAIDSVSKNIAVNGEGGGIYNTGTLTISGSATLDSNVSTTKGGGLYNATNTFTCNGDMTVSRNKAGTTGGGIHKEGTFTCGGNLIISGNIADTYGGGLYKVGLMVCNGNLTLSNDTALYGGGMYGSGNMNMGAGKTITIKDNIAESQGGGMYIVSGTTNFGSSGTPTTINITGNKAGNGGGVYRYGSTGTIITNFYGPTTISNNQADSLGGGIYVNGGTLNIGDATSHQNLTLSDNKADSLGGGLYKQSGDLYCYGQMTISTDTAGDAGGGIFNKGGGITCTELATYNNNIADSGGAFYGASGTINFNDGADFANNTASHSTHAYGGALYVAGSTINFANAASTIGGTSSAQKNTAIKGAGIYIRSGTVNFNYATDITYNEATNIGGGIAIVGGTVNTVAAANIAHNTALVGAGVHMTAGTLKTTAITSTDSLTIHSNTASSNGGGLYMAGGSIANTNPYMSIYGNTALNGGGIYTTTGTIALTKVGVIRNNTATTGNGGGVYNDGGTVSISSATIKENTATVGGGVYTTGNMSFTLANAITGNKASNNGGGIYVNAGTTTLVNTTLSKDTAGVNGGALYVNGGTVNFNTTASTIGGSGNANRAADGAGLYIASGTVNFNVGPTISYNAATGNGGGIYTVASALDLRKTNIQNNTAGSNGGGVFVDDAQNAGDYTPSHIVKVGGTMTIANNTVSGDANNLYARSRNNIQLVETLADTSSVGVYCDRSSTAYPCYNVTTYGMRDDDLFAKVDYTNNTTIEGAEYLLNDLTGKYGEFTSKNHVEAGGYPVSPAPANVASMLSNTRKAESGQDLDAVKWQDSDLPIELLSFVGSCQNGITTFNWETMTETNNDYFTIEASSNAIDYEPVATISGAGTTSQRQQYSYHINTNEGMMYYRLRQTDIDGQTEVFAPIAVQCSDNKSEEPTITIYPQPARDMFEINVQGDGVEIEQMSLYNMLGSCIKRQVVNSRTAAMGLETLSSGVYNLLIKLSNGKLYNKKVVVTK